MGVEMAAAQASRTVEEIWAHSKVAEGDREMLKDESWRAGVRALLYLTCVYVLTGVIIMRRLWLHEACVKKL